MYLVHNTKKMIEARSTQYPPYSYNPLDTTARSLVHQGMYFALVLISVVIPVDADTMLENADLKLPLAGVSCEDTGVHPHLSLLCPPPAKSRQRSAPLTNQSNHDGP